EKLPTTLQPWDDASSVWDCPHTTLPGVLAGQPTAGVPGTEASSRRASRWRASAPDQSHAGHSAHTWARARAVSLSSVQTRAPPSILRGTPRPLARARAPLWGDW